MKKVYEVTVAERVGHWTGTYYAVSRNFDQAGRKAVRCARSEGVMGPHVIGIKVLGQAL